MSDGMWDPIVDSAIEAHRQVVVAEKALEECNRKKQEAISRLNNDQLQEFIKATTK